MLFRRLQQAQGGAPSPGWWCWIPRKNHDGGAGDLHLALKPGSDVALGMACAVICSTATAGTRLMWHST